jgi:uncharacterized protein GlcG (DUF336 family)
LPQQEANVGTGTRVNKAAARTREQEGKTGMASFEKRSINAETALVALQAAVAKARQLGHAMSVCISDENGIPKATIMMDGASDMTRGIAEDKAYTSACLKAPTHGLWDMVKNDPPLLNGLPGTRRATVFGGGYPIIENGKVIGAVGISGAHYSDDMEVARAALAAIGAPVA